MTGFVGRSLAHALRLVLALGLALGAMQLPALAHQYAAALLQVSESGRRDIEHALLYGLLVLLLGSFLGEAAAAAARTTSRRPRRTGAAA